MLSGVSGASLPNTVATAVIGAIAQPTVVTPVISVDSITVSEDDGYAEFVVRLNAPSTSVVTVNYSESNGTAVVNGDYLQASGSLTFAPGQTVKTVQVPIIDNTSRTSNVSFHFNLSNPTNATIAPSSTSVTGTISDMCRPNPGHWSGRGRRTQISPTPPTGTTRRTVRIPRRLRQIHLTRRSSRQVSRASQAVL